MRTEHYKVSPRRFKDFVNEGICEPLAPAYPEMKFNGSFPYFQVEFPRTYLVPFSDLRSYRDLLTNVRNEGYAIYDAIMEKDPAAFPEGFMDPTKFDVSDDLYDSLGEEYFPDDAPFPVVYLRNMDYDVSADYDDHTYRDKVNREPLDPAKISVSIRSVNPAFPNITAIPQGVPSGPAFFFEDEDLHVDVSDAVASDAIPADAIAEAREIAHYLQEYFPDFFPEGGLS